MKYKVSINYDEATESPCEWGGFTVHSFSPRHVNHIRPEKIGIMLNADGDPWVSSKDEYGKPNEYKRLFDRGLMFALDLYQHGNCSWSLHGEGTQCRWDTSRCAGVIILDESEWKGKHWKTKEKAARAFLETYTKWCNGEVYYYTVEDEDGETVDSCGGFYGGEDLFDALSSCANFGDNPEFEFEGDCAWLADYHSIKTGVAA